VDYNFLSCYKFAPEVSFVDFDLSATFTAVRLLHTFGTATSLFPSIALLAIPQSWSVANPDLKKQMCVCVYAWNMRKD
jgi:hypothetical protein